MKWSDSIASQCRYGDVAESIFGFAEVIWEHSEDGYQGYANILARLPDGSFAHYEWSYGSCSGCDEWEALDLSDAEIEQEMRQAMVVMDLPTMRRYLHLDSAVIEGMKYPTANSPTNASIPGMVRQLSGAVGRDFGQMREAFEVWVGEAGGIG